MILRKWSEFRSLPSQYGGGDGDFQRSSVETRASCLRGREAERPRDALRMPFSQLERSSAEGILSPKLDAREHSSLGIATERSSTMFLRPGPPQRARSANPQCGTQAKEPRRDVPRPMEDAERSGGLLLRRGRSLSQLPPEPSSIQLLARKAPSGSELDLRAAFPIKRQRRPEPGEAGCLLGRQPETCEGRNLALELDMMQFELRSLKQKQMESSFIHLEKEKKWLEMMCSEGRKRRGELDEKVAVKLAEVTSCFGERDHGSPSQGSSQNGTMIQEKLVIGRELRNLQESLASLKEYIKALEQKREEIVQQLKSVKEISTSRLTEANQAAAEPLESKQTLQEERSRLLAAYNSIKLEKDQLEEKLSELNLKLKPALTEREIFFQEKVALHQQVQRLTLELELAQKKQKESSDQILALTSELVNTKTQVSQQDQEKDELESLRQSSRELSSEVAEGHRKLQAAVEKLHRLEEEKMFRDECLQALEVERAKLLEEKAQQFPQMLAEEQCQEDARTSLQESFDNLRESQVQLQREKDLLQAHCQDLERQTEDLSRRFDKQRSVSQHWRKRWEQVAEALKTKEDEQKTGTQGQTLFAKEAEAPGLLHLQLEACKQELELEQNHRRTLQLQVQALEVLGDQNSTEPSSEMVTQEASPDLALVREQLQAASEQLKSHETVLEEQRLELESARIQNVECRSEQQRLEQLVIWLEEQLAEKDQALRELKQARDVDGAVLETRRSSSELKGQPRSLDAKVLGNPKQELEGLRQQHHLVTEELKGLFRQRQQQQAGSRNPLDGPIKEEGRVLFRNVPGLLVAKVSTGLSEESHSSAFKNDVETKNLQKELEAKTETISAMACEIQELQEKNESLMKAKLRFQQQIQEIRQLSTQQPEKSHREQQIPGLSIGPREDLQRDHCSESTVALPQSEVVQEPLQGSRESQQVALQEQQRHISPEVKQCHTSSGARAPQTSPPFLPSDVSHQAHKCLPDTPSPPHQLFVSPVASPKEPQNHESEEPLLSPHNSSLVSPRPFGAPRLWSPFRENAKSPEDRREL